jgi:D-glycero-alpha-D-manno-heptose-7-phosphate kinase
MLMTRTPLRISIGGGGTDLPSYYERFGGFVISAAIDKHIYVAINRTFRAGYFLKYSQLEAVSTVDEIEHRVIKACLKREKVGPNLEISSIADIPAGTGLGSSGTFTVGLLHALKAHKRDRVTPEALAREAAEVEMIDLGEPCGKQDQYIAAYGGITCQEYHMDGGVTITPLRMGEEAVRELREGLMMFFTGYSREASKPLNEQKKASEAGDKKMFENLHFIKNLGARIKEALEAGEVDAFGEMMHEHWLHKKERSASMSNTRINDLYDHARANGAVGGKLVGAGGGGFLLFYTHDRRRLRKAMAAQGLHEMDFSFDFEGSVVQLRSSC